MIALVTGVAGFIGGNLAARLIDDGWTVRGVDRFTAYYEESAKRGNLTPILGHERFNLVEADLLTTELTPLVDGVDVVFHQAGQPGVRMSWADGSRLHNEINAYANNFGVPVTSLRCFTVYGPAQRSDMAIHRMIEATLSEGTFPMCGPAGRLGAPWAFVRSERTPTMSSLLGASARHCSPIGWSTTAPAPSTFGQGCAVARRSWPSSPSSAM